MYIHHIKHRIYTIYTPNTLSNTLYTPLNNLLNTVLFMLLKGSFRHREGIQVRRERLDRVLCARVCVCVLGGGRGECCECCVRVCIVFWIMVFPTNFPSPHHFFFLLFFLVSFSSSFFPSSFSFSLSFFLCNTTC